MVEIKKNIKLSQNIQTLIGDIGEKQVLLRLAIYCHGTNWNVFNNLGESGYDLLLQNNVTSDRVRIEVKTRQKLFTTGKKKTRYQFMLTDIEYKSCDFLIAYVIDSNDFYIVPKKELKPTSSNGNPKWRFTLGNINEESKSKNVKYRNVWDVLFAKIDND